MRFLQSLSVFCLPSRYAEQRAMACLEAMAAGVPVVAPRLGLFPELIGLTGGGLLVPVEDPAAVAEALAFADGRSGPGGPDGPRRVRRRRAALLGGGDDDADAGDLRGGAEGAFRTATSPHSIATGRRKPV